MPAPMDTSYLTTQVTTIIGQLHSIFDEIGVPRNERDSRETELFAALSEALHNQLRLVNSEKTKLTEEAQNIINTIKQMEASLDDDKDRGYDVDTNGLRVTFPLIDCLRDLKEKYNIISRLHRERFDQVKKLVQALESYSSHLESSFVKIRLPPTTSNTCPPSFDLSPSFVAALDDEFTRVYDEYNKRVVIVQQTSEEIVRLWSELGIPQAQTDSLIVQNYRDSPEQLGLHQADLDRLRSRRDKLLDEKKGREKRLTEIKKNIETLWDRLGIEEPDRKAFLASNRGCGLRTINEFEDELARLNELKRQNLHLFVEDARVRLQELWDSLFFSEEEMLDFTPAFSDVYSDALLSAHEAEIERLETLKEQRAPILEKVEKYKSLISDRDSLAASANDASRLLLKPQKGEKRDPGKLLREEKMRKRIAKELPKLTAELAKILIRYEDEYGRPFLIHGENFLDELEEAEVKAPPPRSKTPNGLPPRAKTPAPATSTTKPATSGRATAQPARPASVMKAAPPTARSTAKTPTGSRPGTIRQQGGVAAAPQTKSPSKIPARAPTTGLKSGNQSPERRAIPRPTANSPQKQLQHSVQEPLQQNYAQNARSMGPPRAPPPKMRDLFVPPEQTPSNAMDSFPAPSVNRPLSTVSSSSNESSRYVRPISPEDVYHDSERMSYMSASLVNRGQAQYHQQQPFHQSQIHHQESHYPPQNHTQSAYQNQSIHQHSHQPSFSSSTSMRSHDTSHQHVLSAPQSTISSRQPSNTSSNMTTGTTASGSENWETFSDGSEMEPERDVRDSYYAKVQQHQALSTTNALGMNPNLNGKRPLTAHGPGDRSHLAGQMAPPPAKIRMHANNPHYQPQQFREVSDENIRRVDDSDATWSTEVEETY
ncbi:hypothetical protein LTR84_005532 [Exophiala bonariae]|uniref:Anaphase spindle elongation protein 1 n=1 Tax=Exophiala bonariae TaxID=1690606 RepID=A0AAV9N6A9_9EURO|nr:hypothetical protein LTR84_005532 [Exophiala bonariae]